MVFQQFNLFPHLTVLDNVTLAPRQVRRIRKTAPRSWGWSCSTRLRIPDQAKKYPGPALGRAAAARRHRPAVAMRPKVMLFDEPTSASTRR